MKFFKVFYLYVIIASALLIVANIYSTYRLAVPYSPLSSEFVMALFISFVIQGLFIYFAFKEKKIIFVFLFLKGCYFYFSMNAAFGLEAVFYSSIEHFTVSTLLNFINPIVALVAILYWWCSSRTKLN